MPVTECYNLGVASILLYIQGGHNDATTFDSTTSLPLVALLQLASLQVEQNIPLSFRVGVSWVCCTVNSTFQCCRFCCMVGWLPSAWRAILYSGPSWDKGHARSPYAFILCLHVFSMSMAQHVYTCVCASMCVGMLYVHIQGLCMQKYVEKCMYEYVYKCTLYVQVCVLMYCYVKIDRQICEWV